MKIAKNIFFVVFGLFVGILLVVNITRVSTNQVTFSSLLSYISNAPRVFTDFTIQDFTIVGSWGILNGLKDFLNLFAQLFGFIISLGKSLVNLLVYAFYFVAFLF